MDDWRKNLTIDQKLRDFLKLLSPETKQVIYSHLLKREVGTMTEGDLTLMFLLSLDEDVQAILRT